MQKAIVAVVVLAFMAVAWETLTWGASLAADKQHTFLSSLTVGQQVSLKQDFGRYEINSVEGVAAVQGHKVIEIGNDFVVVHDIAGVTESRIPLWSIKSIVRLKLQGLRK